MMSSDARSSVLAGQRWLHSIADVGLTEANLVQSLLCRHLTDALATVWGLSSNGTGMYAKGCRPGATLVSVEVSNIVVEAG